MSKHSKRTTCLFDLQVKMAVITMQSLKEGIKLHVTIASRGLHLLRDLAYIDGKWLGANSCQTFPVLNPVNKSVIKNVPDMNPEDTRAAINAASKAFETFKLTTAKERSDLLRNWYNLMVKHSEDLAQILTKENGKSLAESRGEIKYGNSFIEWFSEEARRVNGEVLQAPILNRELLLLKQPVGVSALITPWNFPHAMITRKAGAALAAGCTCVVKPSEDTPLTALALADLAEKAGFPAGTFNVITTSIKNSAAVGKELCDNPAIRVLSFTGSTNIGKILYQQCAGTMKRLSLELGGNAPYIVFNSADLDAAVTGAMASKFRNTGQTCVSANRFFVQAEIFDKFIEKYLVKINSEIKMGDGSKEGITHGPLVKDSQLQMVDDLVQDAIYITKDMKIYNKEIFGPVAVINKFHNEEDVLKEANDTPVGLAGYFYSQDISQVFRVARKMEVGMVGVNEGLISSTEAAFGGIKESGLGREGSSHGIDDFIDIKYVCLGNLRY
ncbi:hypothetical protein HZH66_000490 [Vespula vulgaris]|uniref:Aldehyde dehydrogenase domain-containing protein n=1 Tax=Vespula vulgaris TaxID=7454 RepID=A0A834KP70_VESVU|nr:hypothetical protein HZH66_000490 [Vespula vulgaris]